MRVRRWQILGWALLALHCNSLLSEIDRIRAKSTAGERGATTDATYQIGGMLSGLSGTLRLQLNGGEILTLTADGAYFFNGRLAAGSLYSVAVVEEPATQQCILSNASGTMPAGDVTNVDVTCQNVYSVGGSVSGLSGTLQVENRGEFLSISTATLTFTFITRYPNGTAYNVRIAQNPAGQVCWLSNHEGVISGANITDVTVNCAADTNWTQDAYLKASNAETQDLFGFAVAYGGNNIAVGAPQEDAADTFVTNTNGVASSSNARSNSGAVYVFRVDNFGNWFQDAYLKASNSDVNDGFGSSVAAASLTIAVGAPPEASSSTTIINADNVASPDNTAAFAGAVYVFRRNIATGDWHQDAYLKPSNASAGDQFGYQVALGSNNMLVVSSLYEDSSQTTITNADGVAAADDSSSDSGAVYIFGRMASTGDWYQDVYLKPANTQNDMNFGYAIATDGTSVIASARLEDSGQTTITNTNDVASFDTSSANSGAAYIFRQNASGNWFQDAYLKASNNTSGDAFGCAVAIDGNFAVVGACGEDSNTTVVINTDGAAAPDNALMNAGAAYIFKRDASGNWIQDAYLKASNAGNSDEFGYAVTISGSFVAVGVPSEDSNQTTITNTNSTASSNNTAPSAGAIYVFTRDSNGDWYQDAYLKASNAATDQQLGFSLTLRGSYLVAGAPYEDSSQTTVTNTDNSASSDTSAANAGAVYIFRMQ